MADVNFVIPADGEMGGSTQRSLTRLRDALAEYRNDEIHVLEVPTHTDAGLVGYLILNKTRGLAFWTGDAFRPDKKGEGGAGYITARLLLKRIWRLHVNEWDVLSMQPVLEQKVSLEDHLRSYIREFEFFNDHPDIVFKIPASRPPEYIREGSI